MQSGLSRHPRTRFHPSVATLLPLHLLRPPLPTRFQPGQTRLLLREGTKSEGSQQVITPTCSNSRCPSALIPSRCCFAQGAEGKMGRFTPKRKAHMSREQKIQRAWRSFEAARTFVHELRLNNQREWYAYCHSGEKPTDIPATPHLIYQGKFQGLGDWLGTGRIGNTKRIYRTFEDARAFVRSLRLKNQKEWRAYCRSRQKPADIPTTPERAYKQEFQGYGDWLGSMKT